LRGDLTVNEAVAIAGGFTQQARHSQVVVFRRISAYVAESHVIDLKKMLDAHDRTRICTCKPAILCCAAEPDLENPQVCSDQRAELVYESIAVLDLVLEEKEWQRSLCVCKIWPIPKVLPELTRLLYPHVND